MITRVGDGGISNRAIRPLTKYTHGTQEALAEIIIRKEIPTTKVSDFTKLYDQNPDADLDKLADKALGIETITVPVSKIPVEVFAA